MLFINLRKITMWNVQFFMISTMHTGKNIAVIIILSCIYCELTTMELVESLNRHTSMSCLNSVYNLQSFCCDTALFLWSSLPLFSLIIATDGEFCLCWIVILYFILWLYKVFNILIWVSSKKNCIKFIYIFYLKMKLFLLSIYTKYLRISVKD